MVIQIAPCYIDLNAETGGVANIIRQICLSLDKHKIKTTLVCGNTELGKVMAQPEVFQYSDNLTVHIVAQKSHPLLGSSKSIQKILSSLGCISLIHVHTCFSVICDASLKYAVKNKIPCVFTPHGKLSPSMFGHQKMIKFLYFNLRLKKYLNKTIEIVTSSPDEVTYVQRLSVSGKISSIYNGYQRPETTMVSEPIKSAVSQPYLLFLGYLEPRKKPDLLIRAYKQSQACGKYKLVLAGPDAYGFGEGLQNLVSSLGLSHDVIFTGRVSGYDKWHLIENSIGLFLPSAGEGWPVVIAEAIGAKVPMVISKSCNFSEINQLGLGIEVTDFSELSWAKAINELCFDHELYIRFKENLAIHSTAFSWAEITKQWIDKYKIIINGTRA